MLLLILLITQQFFHSYLVGHFNFFCFLQVFSFINSEDEFWSSLKFYELPISFPMSACITHWMGSCFSAVVLLLRKPKQSYLFQEDNENMLLMTKPCILPLSGMYFFLNNSCVKNEILLVPLILLLCDALIFTCSITQLLFSQQG